MAGFGYNSYRGRGGGGKAVVIVVLVVLLVAVGIFIYMAVADGLAGLPQVETPVSQTPPVTGTPAPPSLVVETSATPEPTPSPSPTQRVPEVLRTYHITDITDHTQVAAAVQMAMSGRVNSVVVLMKDDIGKLAYISEIAPDWSAETTPLAHLDELRDAGLFMIAELYAFEDSVASDANRAWSVATQNGTRWLDWQYHGWLNAKVPEARGYIADITGEVLELGFDRVLYQSFDFPHRGRPELLYYEDETPEQEVLDAFKAELDTLYGDKLMYETPYYVELPTA